MNALGHLLYLQFYYDSNGLAFLLWLKGNWQHTTLRISKRIIRCPHISNHNAFSPFPFGATFWTFNVFALCFWNKQLLDYFFICECLFDVAFWRFRCSFHIQQLCNYYCVWWPWSFPRVHFIIITIIIIIIFFLQLVSKSQAKRYSF